MSDQQAPQAQGPAINRVPAYGYPHQGGPYQQAGPPQMQPGYSGAPIQQQAVEEHWILNCGGAPEQHLGFLKETFKRGAVITHDLTNNRLIINGRVFYDVRDLDIMKNQMHRSPQRPWVLPYSEEVLQDIQQGYMPQTVQENSVRDPRDHSMPVIQEDAYDRPDIDIRHTKVAANNAHSRTQQRQRAANEPLEVIRGDESVEDRIARLKDNNDPKSIAERERLKRQPWKPPIVRDDSLGMGTGQRDISLNAGQPLPSRESAAANAERAAAEAAARKREAEMRRGYGVHPQTQPQYHAPVPQQVADIDPSLYDEVAPGMVQPLAPQAQQPIPNTAAPDARIDLLEGQVANIAENMSGMMAMMQQMMRQSVGDGIERTPVTDDATAQAVAKAQQV